MESQTQETEKLREITPGGDQSRVSDGEPNAGEGTTPSALQSLRTLLDKARQNQKPVTSRRELSRDRSKSLFLLVGVSVALLLVFFGLFSNPKGRTLLAGNRGGAPNLGRKITPGQGQNDAAKSVTPFLSADLRQGQSGTTSEVTPE